MDVESPPVDQTREKETNFTAEIWVEFRPYLLSLITDFLIAIGLWGFLWLFKEITGLVPIRKGWAGKFIRQLHNVGTVAAFGLFAALFVTDLLRIYKKKGGKRS